ncbi:MAG: hypothetical protein AAF891_02845 [Pseudomonadota bacterium]
MSDPVTNIEIEDVLSSIRRLVSDEGRTARAPIDASEDAQGADKGSGKTHELAAVEADTPAALPQTPPPALILTPALRVASEEASDVAAQDERADRQSPYGFMTDGAGDDDHNHDYDHDMQDAEPSAEAEPAQHDQHDQHDQDDHASDASSVWAQPEHIDHDDAAHDQGAEASTGEDAAADEDQQEDAARIDVSPDDEAGSDHDTGDYAHHSDAEQPKASEEEGAQDLSFEPVEQAFEPAPESAPIESAEIADTPPQQELPQASVVQDPADRSIEDKIAALEALIGPSDAGFEAETSESREHIAKVTRLPWPTDTRDVPTADAADLPDPAKASQSADIDAQSAAFDAGHAAAVQDINDEIVHVAATTLPQDLDSEAAPLIDEDVLRDMVAEIVRQELQGPLGERITRNVRKLVRREIYRAMAANELD